MSENTDSEPRKAITKAIIAEMLARNFEKLPDIDQKVFSIGPRYFGVYAGLAGLIANSLYRRALNVTQAHFTSSLPMAALPFLTTVVVYNEVVCRPLLSGDLKCPSCALIRGALVGVVFGAVCPIALALPLNFALAEKYNTALMPEKGNVLRYCINVSRPVLKKMRAVVLLQAVFGSYLGSRNFQSYTKLAEITFGSGEELED